ncbi:hypothetical protein HDU91_005501, partial [Kappamyces sp. JEL0680]
MKTSASLSALSVLSVFANAACSHDICSTGAALKASCDPCAAKMATADSYCSTTKWDAQCVGQ